MSPSPRPFVRTTAGRLAVAGVAALASVSAVAPAAFADDTDLAPESTEQTPEPPAPSVETPPAPEVDTPTETELETGDEPAAPAPETESENGSSKTSEGTVTAKAEAVEEDVEYGPQTIAVTFSRIPDAFYGDYYGEPITPQAVVNIFRGEDFVRTVVCTSELSSTESAPRTVDCLFEGSPTIELQPGERAEAYSAFGGEPAKTVQPCQVDECSSTLVELDFVVPAPFPGVSAYYSPRVFQGEPVSQDLLAADSVEDPTTTVRIVSGPENGTATLGADGRTLTYTSDEDFSDTEVITYEATNRNGTSTGSWEIRVFDPMVPDFGSQKYRIGVQVASGAFVPDDTTTVGSTFEIVTTSATGETTTRTCTTTSPTATGDGSSVCGTDVYDYLIGTSLPAGSRAVITQTGVPEGQDLLPDPDPIVIEPCDRNITDPCPDVTAQFEMRGSILPETTPDTATADQGGEPIIIDVLDNDTSEDPNTGLEVTPLPAEQGTIEVIGEAAPPVNETPGDVGILAVPSAGTLALRYTPPADFSGEVPVEYAVTNSNGSTSETLTITVRPAAEVPTDPEIPTLPTDPGGPVTPPTPPTVGIAPAAVENSTPAPARVGAGSSMPDTGGPASSLLGIGFVLAAAGAGILGRRRSTPTRGH